MSGEEYIEAVTQLERQKEEGRFIELVNRNPSYDGENEIDERIY